MTLRAAVAARIRGRPGHERDGDGAEMPAAETNEEHASRGERQGQAPGRF